MTQTLANRLAKLEGVIRDPSGERQQRMAEGRCPDCGFDHDPQPASGGVWRCVVCTHRFTLAPGPACNQSCPSCRARQRRPKREQQNAEQRRAAERVDDMRTALRDLQTSMTPEHWAMVSQWSDQHADLEEALRSSSGAYEALERLQVPALLRAALVLVVQSVVTNVKAVLPAAVAEVYANHHDAWPSASCPGCGYLLPARASVQADGTLRTVGRPLVKVCPVCGTDASQKEV